MIRFNEDIIERACVFHNFLMRMFKCLSDYYYEDKEIVIKCIADEIVRQEEYKKAKEMKNRKKPKQKRSKTETSPKKKRAGFSRKKSRTAPPPQTDYASQSKSDSEDDNINQERKKDSSSKATSRKPASKTGLSNKKAQKRKTPTPAHYSDVSDDESLDQRKSRNKSRVQTLNEGVLGWGYKGPKPPTSNAQSKARTHTHKMKRNVE